MNNYEMELDEMFAICEYEEIGTAKAATAGIAIGIDATGVIAGATLKTVGELTIAIGMLPAAIGDGTMKFFKRRLRQNVRTVKTYVGQKTN